MYQKGRVRGNFISRRLTKVLQIHKAKLWIEDGRLEMKHKASEMRHRQENTNPKKPDIERQKRRAIKRGIETRRTVMERLSFGEEKRQGKTKKRA